MSFWWMKSNRLFPVRSICEPQSHKHTCLLTFQKKKKKKETPFPHDDNLLMLIYSQHYLFIFFIFFCQAWTLSIVARCTGQDFCFGGIHSHDGMLCSPPYCTRVCSLNIESNKRRPSSQGLVVSPPQIPPAATHAKRNQISPRCPWSQFPFRRPVLKLKKNMGSGTTGQAWFSIWCPFGHLWTLVTSTDVGVSVSGRVLWGWVGVTLATAAYLLTPLGFHWASFQPTNVCAEPSVKKNKRIAPIKTAQQSKKKSDSVQ